MREDWKKILKVDEDERSRTEELIRNHWQDNSICMIELIRMEYSLGTNSQNNEFFVIIDYDVELDWLIGCDLKSELTEQVTSKLNIIKAIPHSTLSIEQKLQFNRLLGNALVAAINKQSEDAERLLDESRNYVIRRLSEYSKKWTLLSATLFLFIIIIFNWILGERVWNFDYPNLWLGII